jgi:hypothetical protein
MTVLFQSGYALPATDEPLTNARIAHSGNWVTGGAGLATSTDADFFVDGPLNSLTYEKWRATSSTSTWTFVGGGTNTLDYVCIGAHNFGDIGASITVQVLSGGTWTTVGSSPSITSNMPIYVIFSPTSATSARVQISGGIGEIGVFKIGRSLQMQQAIYGGHSPLNLSRNTVMRSNMSTTGEFLGRTKIRTSFSTSFSWSEITAAWVRDNWRPFQLASEEEPFFIAWRPLDFSEVGLCYVNGLSGPSNQGLRDFMSINLDVMAYGYD